MRLQRSELCGRGRYEENKLKGGFAAEVGIPPTEVGG
jgi:hypothetical protein